MTRPYVASRSGEPLHRRSFDVLVLGGGIAGLTAAIGAARRWRVGLLTKSTFDDTTTFLAQGGIAAAIGEERLARAALQPTPCRPAPASATRRPSASSCNEGPDRVRELMEICPRFDKVDGQIVLGREGAHSLPRIVHAGGDATGSEVSSALAEAARLGSRVQLYEDEFVIDLLTVDGRCVGALTLNLADGGLTLNVAMVTVLATGGAGQVYGRTTNPPVATGDGVAMAYRAGAAIRDLEFVQFHPTGLADAGPADRAAHHRGAARRGRLPAQRRRRAVHDRVRPARRARLARRRRARHGRRDAPRGHRPRLPRRDAPRRRLAAGAVPARHRRPARARPRPRHAAHPGGAGVPLLHRRRGDRRVGPHHGARPVRQRRGGEHRRPRRQPARQQLAARGPRLLRPRGARPRPLHRPARRGRAPAELRHPGGGRRRRRQRRRRRPPPPHRRHAAQGRRAAPRGRAAGGAGRARRPHVASCASGDWARPSTRCSTCSRWARRSPSARCCARSRAACTCATTSRSWTTSAGAGTSRCGCRRTSARRASAGSSPRDDADERAQLPAGGARRPRGAPCARTSPATATSPGRSSPATASRASSRARPACSPARPRSRRRRGWSTRRSPWTSSSATASASRPATSSPSCAARWRRSSPPSARRSTSSAG